MYPCMYALYLHFIYPYMTDSEIKIMSKLLSLADTYQGIVLYRQAKEKWVCHLWMVYM